MRTRGGMSTGFQLSKNFLETWLYLALPWFQIFLLVVFEQESFRKMTWYIKIISLNQQIYKKFYNVPERKGSCYDLVFPFPRAFTFLSLILFLPLWNNLILYVQKWLVKNRARVGLIAPVGDYTWAEELPVIHGDWIKISVAISSLQVRKFWIISCRVVECWSIRDLDEQEHLRNESDSEGYKFDTTLERNGLSSFILFSICWARSFSHIDSFRIWVA